MNRKPRRITKPRQIVGISTEGLPVKARLKHLVIEKS